MAILLHAVPAGASEPHFGLQAHGAFPAGTLGDDRHLDGRIGLGLGFQVPVDFGAGHVLRPKLDYLVLNRNSGGIRYKVDSLQLMVDYNYYLEDRREGAYFIGGLGMHSTRRDVTRSFNAIHVTNSGTSTGLCYNAGMGYAFNRNLAVELKYLGIDLSRFDFKGQPSDPSYMGNSLVASFSFTF